MKRNLLLSALLLCSTMAASAGDYYYETDNYTRLDLNLVSTQPVTTSYSYTAISQHNLYGLGLSYLRGVNLTGKRLPLFLEMGPEVNFVRRSDEVDYWDDNIMVDRDNVNTQLLTLSMPVDLAYQYRVTDVIVLAAAAGVNAKANLMAKTSVDSETTDLFDEGASRFQMGWNAGCGIYFNRFYLGFRFTADITPFMEHGEVKERFQSSSLSLGLRF